MRFSFEEWVMRHPEPPALGVHQIGKVSNGIEVPKEMG